MKLRYLCVAPVLAISTQLLTTAVPFPPSSTVIAHRDSVDPNQRIDIADPIPGWHWEKVALMPFGRKRGNTTLLSNGSIMLVGGTLIGSIGTQSDSLQALIYDPRENQWRNVDLVLSSSPGEARRLVPLALADGRALVMESNYGDHHADPSGAAFHLYEGDGLGWVVVVGPDQAATPSNAYELGAATVVDDHTVIASMEIVGHTSDRGFRPLPNVWSFDLVSRKWTDALPLSMSRCCGAMARLLDGRILASGGIVDEFTAFPFEEVPNPVATTELRDSLSGNWTSAPPMHFARELHSATTLSDGRVLVIGDSRWKPPEVYEPDVNRWTILSATRQNPLGAAVAPVVNGGALIVSGYDTQTNRRWNQAAWLIPESGEWLQVDPPPDMDGISGAQSLSDGRILVIGWGSTNAALLVQNGTISPTPQSNAVSLLFLPLCIRH